jgi:hypothetical protein
LSGQLSKNYLLFTREKAGEALIAFVNTKIDGLVKGGCRNREKLFTKCGKTWKRRNTPAYSEILWLM